LERAERGVSSLVESLRLFSCISLSFVFVAIMASAVSDYEDHPISRTYQYRKVMKPMLERKRRARINRCLDQLKELMVTALQSEGENVSKLEKADVLELTVQHLHKLKRQQMLGLTPEATYADRFKAGFNQCASEVSKYLSSVPGVDMHVTARLVSHLGLCLRQIEKTTPLRLSVAPPTSYTPPSSPVSEPLTPLRIRGQYWNLPLQLTLKPVEKSSDSVSVCSDVSSDSVYSNDKKSMWRPW